MVARGRRRYLGPRFRGWHRCFIVFEDCDPNVAVNRKVNNVKVQVRPRRVSRLPTTPEQITGTDSITNTDTNTCFLQVVVP